jgi:hypothetical protein
MQTVVHNPGQRPRRVGRFGTTQPERSEYVVAGIAAFIGTLDLILLPMAIVSFIKL